MQINDRGSGPGPEILVSAQGLGKRFGRRTVLDDVSLDLPAGTVTGFLGANGSGKTTAIRLMLGLATGPGRTLYFGKPLGVHRAPARIVGAVLGGVAGHPSHTVRTHLRAVAAGIGVASPRVDEVLSLVGLSEAAGLRLKALSLGMAQRVGIAQALLGDPAVLVLDEPANGLDPHSLTWLRGFVRDLARSGKAVLISSHLLGEMEQTADRVVVLAQGRVVATGAVGELTARASGFVTVESPQAARLAELATEAGARVRPQDGADPTGTRLGVEGLDRFQVGELAARHGIALSWLDERRPTLEDFYLSVADEEFRIR
ncbi:ABC transporter ATP-binding protein [Kitasatospora sp. NPDC004289]